MNAEQKLRKLIREELKKTKLNELTPGHRSNLASSTGDPELAALFDEIFDSINAVINSNPKVNKSRLISLFKKVLDSDF